MSEDHEIREAAPESGGGEETAGLRESLITDGAVAFGAHAAYDALKYAAVRARDSFRHEATPTTYADGPAPTIDDLTVDGDWDDPTDFNVPENDEWW